jgi:hypothetical protein
LPTRTDRTPPGWSSHNIKNIVKRERTTARGKKTGRAARPIPCSIPTTAVVALVAIVRVYGRVSRVRRDRPHETAPLHLYPAYNSEPAGGLSYCLSEETKTTLGNRRYCTVGRRVDAPFRSLIAGHTGSPGGRAWRTNRWYRIDKKCLGVRSKWKVRAGGQNSIDRERRDRSRRRNRGSTR